MNFTILAAEEAQALREHGEVLILCGRDLSLHKHTIAPSELRHIRKRHPELTDEDVMLMLDMQENWDSLKYTYSDNIPRLEYHKKYDGKNYIMVERIGRAHRNKEDLHSMQFTTIYPKSK